LACLEDQKLVAVHFQNELAITDQDPRLYIALLVQRLAVGAL